MLSFDVSIKIQEKMVYTKKIMFGIPVHVIVKLIDIKKNFFDALAIKCDENIDVSVTVSINLNRKATGKMDKYYILLTFLLVTVFLLIIFTIA